MPNRAAKSRKQLSADLIGRGGAWLDTGSIDDFYKTSAFGKISQIISGIDIRQKYVNSDHGSLIILLKITFVHKSPNTGILGIEKIALSWQLEKVVNLDENSWTIVFLLMLNITRWH